MNFAKVHCAGREMLIAKVAGLWRDLSAGLKIREVSDAMSHWDEHGVSAIRDCPELTEVPRRWLPPVARDTRILCAGFNFKEHAQESARELPRHPTFFARYPSSFVGADEPLLRPNVSTSFDWEGEIAVVIKRGGRSIPRDRAMEHVGGYVCLGDHSVRDFQLHSTQATAGKNFDSSGAIGPWVVTADEVGDPGSLEVVTMLNGEEMQRGKLCDLVFDIPALIEYISAFMALRPGDIIATGTPAGIGARRNPPRWLVPGDEIAVTAHGLGRLSNRVVDQADAPGETRRAAQRDAASK